jgi:signal transduction histidine kinase
MSSSGQTDPADSWASEHAARRLAEASADRIAHLQAATAALSAAGTPVEVADATLDAALEMLGAVRRMVLVPNARGSALEVLRAVGDADVAPLVAAAAEAWRDRVTVLVDGVAGAAANDGIAAFPLVLHDRAVGVLAVGFDGPRALEDSERALAAALASQCALALDRARLFREVQLAAQAQEEFLHVASHELRAPLGTLCLAVRLLARDARARAGLDVDGRVRTIERQAERLARLSDALLDLTRITAGRLELQREAADLTSLVRDAAARVVDEAAAARCALTVDAPGPVEAALDPQRMEQVIDNLLSNAIKYGRGTPVDVSVRREGDRGVLVVSDRGIGISAEHQDRIFGRFERAVEDRRYPGLGLGLWIVRQVVEAHGGTIRVESTPGQGAAFTVELPLETR